MKYYSDGLFLVRIATNKFIVEINVWNDSLTIWKRSIWLNIFERKKQVLTGKQRVSQQFLFPSFSIFNENNICLLSDKDLNLRIEKLLKLKAFL